MQQANSMASEFLNYLENIEKDDYPLDFSVGGVEPGVEGTSDSIRTLFDVLSDPGEHSFYSASEFGSPSDSFPYAIVTPVDGEEGNWDLRNESEHDTDNEAETSTKRTNKSQKKGKRQRKEKNVVKSATKKRRKLSAGDKDETMDEAETSTNHRKSAKSAEELSLAKTMPPFRYTCSGCGQDHFISAQSMAAHAARCTKYQAKNKKQEKKGPLKNTKQPVTQEWWELHLKKMLKKGLNPYHPSSPFSRATVPNVKSKSSAVAGAIAKSEKI